MEEGDAAVKGSSKSANIISREVRMRSAPKSFGGIANIRSKDVVKKSYHTNDPLTANITSRGSGQTHPVPAENQSERLAVTTCVRSGQGKELNASK